MAEPNQPLTDAERVAMANANPPRDRNRYATALSNFGMRFTLAGREMREASSDALSQVVPKFLGEKVVHAVEAGRFSDADKKTMFRIVMDPTVRSIDPNYAQNAMHLRVVRFSPILDGIPAGSFDGARNLVDANFEVLEQATYIGDNALRGTAIRDLPLDKMRNVVEIGNSACADNPHLRHVTYGPDCEVRIIGDYAWAGCKNLVDQRRARFGGRGDFVFPPKTEVIGKGCVAGCWKIKSLDIGANVREITGNPFLSETHCYKGDTGDLKLRARWHLWRSKINIPGVDETLRAKDFESMTTDLDGLRHIKTKDYHYIQQKDGTFIKKNAADYDAWLKQTKDEIANYQVNAQELSDYLTQQFGVEITTAMIEANKNTLIKINQGKEVTFSKDGQTITINGLAFKEVALRQSRDVELQEKKAREAMGKQMAETLQQSGFVDAYNQQVEQQKQAEQQRTQDMADAMANASQGMQDYYNNPVGYQLGKNEKGEYEVNGKVVDLQVYEELKVLQDRGKPVTQANIDAILSGNTPPSKLGLDEVVKQAQEEFKNEGPIQKPFNQEVINERWVSQDQMDAVFNPELTSRPDMRTWEGRQQAAEAQAPEATPMEAEALEGEVPPVVQEQTEQPLTADDFARAQDLVERMAAGDTLTDEEIDLLNSYMESINPANVQERLEQAARNNASTRERNAATASTERTAGDGGRTTA